MLGTQEQRTEGMKRQAHELIDQTYQRGFKAGQVDNKTFNGLIERGRNEAWEAARKITLSVSNGGIDMHELTKIFGNGLTYSGIFKNNTASEAIEKIRAYEAQKQEAEDEIRVGDEVYLIDSRYPSVVTCIFEEKGCDKVVGITKAGKWVVNILQDLHKTGKHYDEIAQILAKMKEGEE